MATTDLGACEWFVWDLRRSNLIDRGQLDQVVGDYLKRHPRSEPPQLAEHLVRQGILTQFQADRILQGKTQGLVLGPYTLTDSIGSGSMGTVYKAISKTDNKWYAVKVLPRRSMWNVRLARRQVRQFETFSHPQVVPFMDVGTSGGLHYLAWPLIQGESMDSVVQREGKLPPEVAALYAMQTAQGLQACHAHSIFHGLLKPSNLMLGPDGQIHILDLGIGALLSENEGESLVDTMSTATTLTSGLDCASPESIMEPTNRTAAGDQYSLGCCLYFFLTGRYPFPEGSAVEKMMAHQYKQPTPLRQLVPNVPAELENIVERLMQKAPEKRYSSCEEVAEALRPLAAAAAPTVRPLIKGSGNGATGTPSAVPTNVGGTKPAVGSGGAGTTKSPAGVRDSSGPPAIGSGGKPGSLRAQIQGGGGRPGPTAPPPPPKRELPPEEDDEEPSDAVDEGDEIEEEGEEQEGGLGTILMIVGAVLVAGLAFWLAMQWFGRGS